MWKVWVELLYWMIASSGDSIQFNPIQQKLRYKNERPLQSSPTPNSPNRLLKETKFCQKETPGSPMYMAFYATLAPRFLASPLARDLPRRALFAFQSISTSPSWSLSMDAVKSRWRVLL